MITARQVHAEVSRLRNPAQATVSQRYFKTGPGQYGEGDIFYGIMVPQARIIAKKFKNLEITEIEKLLFSKIHEERFIALQILAQQFNEGDNVQKKKIYTFYLAHTKHINNWDLVDTSAHKIVGEYLLDKSTNILLRLAKSKNVWERRIAIISTFQFIRNNRFDVSLATAQLLLNDKHDLMHKAVGWMLREVGKRSLAAEEEFLKKYYLVMPRTMLRYAIERFPEVKRKQYMLKIKIPRLRLQLRRASSNFSN